MSNDIVRLRTAYLDLLRDTIINAIYKDPAMMPVRRGLMRRLFGVSYRSKNFDLTKREKGLDWPSMAHSMIGMQRMENLRQCACTVLEDNIPGDFVETGVWRGGACILMRGVLKAYGVTDRLVWVADSFAGLPMPNAAKYKADRGDDHHVYEALAVSQEQVAENFKRYDLLDEQVKFLKGWFSETLPSAPIDKIAVLRLDGDMYESTMDALNALYNKVSPGGFVIIDDFHAVPGCRKAVEDYIAANGLAVKLEEIDGTGVYWRMDK